jgi:negative modulator of initiation of replication
MKFIEVEDDLYRYIASKTESIGESASAILRRLLGLAPVGEIAVEPALKAQPSPASTVVASKVTAPTVVASIKDDLTKIKKARVQKVSPITADFASLVEHPQVLQQKTSIGRFLEILSLLYSQQPQEFVKVLTVSGRDRLYFAKDQQALLASGASSKPKQIAGTPYWVVTNSNNGMKCRILKKALLAVGCKVDIAEKIIEQI